MMIRFLVSLLVPLLLSGGGSHAHSHHNKLSRHLVLEDLSMVIIMAEAEQTQGPFAEQEDDYVWTTNDLTAAGRAGAPGLTEDRLSVVNGAPLQLVMTVYDVSNPNTVGGIEMEGVEIFLWHTDAAGVYSAVDDPQQPTEFQLASKQVWCRGVQVTNTTGQVTFHTILPGWYPGRALHYHLRLRLPGQTVFAATSQLYVSDDDLNMLQTLEPYSFNTQSTTVLQRDGIYGRLDPIVQDQLTLKLEGSADTGFTSALRLGLVPSEVSPNQGDGSGGASDADGNGAAGENVVLNVANANADTVEPSPMPTVRQTSNPTMMPTGTPIIMPTPPPTMAPTALPMSSLPLPTILPTITTTTITTTTTTEPPSSFSPAPRPVPAPVLVVEGPEGTFFFDVGSMNHTNSSSTVNSTNNNNSTTNNNSTELDVEVQKDAATSTTEKDALSSSSWRPYGSSVVQFMMLFLVSTLLL